MNKISLAILAFALCASPALAQDDVPENVQKLESAIVKAVAKVSPCFVVIGGGSGVVISEDGYMLTNHHVAGGRSIGSDWRVKLPDGKIYMATMIGTDPLGDISLLKIKPRKKGKPFPYVPLGDSDKLSVGEWVIALGNPFGFAKDSTPTVTIGLVSAFNRYRGNYGDAIQTDTPINSGNSGGPLININGELVGINGSITTRHGVKINSGAGYAISVNQIKRFMGVLKRGGVVAHGRMNGVRAVNTDDGGTGALLADVSAGSKAAAGGLKKGDVVLAINKLPVKTAARFYGAVSTFPAGSTVTVTLRRSGKTETHQVELDEYFRGRAPGNRPLPTGGFLGASMRNTDDGVQVRRVTADSPAAKGGLKTGDIVLALDGQTVQNTNELRQLLRAKRAGDKIRFKVSRKGEELKLSVTLGKRR